METLAQAQRPAVIEFPQQLTSFDAGHNHIMFVFANTDRMTGWTSIDQGHFHIFDVPIDGLGLVPVVTSMALAIDARVTHNHTAFKSLQGAFREIEGMRD